MDFSNVHILLCDHDSSTGSETLALLQKCSYNVSSVRTAEQAVDALESEGSTVDVVLTDVELPKEESFKVLKHIFRKQELGHIAVVVMSEHDEMALVAKCLSLGAVDYLVKPLRLNEVTNLWTHMWRKRRVMNLPDKELGIMSAKVSSNFQKPAETADLLSGYRRSEATPPATGAWHRAQAKEDYGSQVELSLRLSLNHTVGEMPGHSCVASLSSQPSSGHRKVSAFSTYLRSCNQQPDEQSGTNACSSSNSPSKQSKSLNECVINGNQEPAFGVLADASNGSSPKEASAADETRPTDMESQICDRSKKQRTEQVPPHFLSADERIFHGGQLSPVHLQGFQPCYAFMGVPPLNARQGEAPNGPEATASSTYDVAANPSPGQAFPVYYHESGMATMPSVQNVFSCYPVAHLAVPVMNLSSWLPMGRPPPLVGGKVIQAERREAALNKFRMKRKGRCFEKKIRYASRKKLAEQRPRVRGQFVKRSALAEHIETQAASDEEGEADDEQGCSELDNQSSPDCAAENYHRWVKKAVVTCHGKRV